VNSIIPISSSSTTCIVPLALNHFGLRGSHFQAVLKEFATICYQFATNIRFHMNSQPVTLYSPSPGVSTVRQFFYSVALGVGSKIFV
jgi:hypothetical protein